MILLPPRKNKEAQAEEKSCPVVLAREQIDNRVPPGLEIRTRSHVVVTNEIYPDVVPEVWLRASWHRETGRAIEEPHANQRNTHGRVRRSGRGES
jgi:hypothetical protein